MTDVTELHFTEFAAEDVERLKEYYYLRPNRSCDNAPLDSYLWRDYYKIKRCVIEGKAVLMIDEEQGEAAGALPLCREADLPEYFKLLERYFNEVLKQPFQVFLADAEGMEYLKAAGALENYDIKEEEDLKDYLYDAESLRTLAGRKLSKKRNHINKFEKEYAGRWEYRTLTKADKLDMLSFLTNWKLQKDEVGEGEGTAADGTAYDAMESLDAEILGVHDILNHDCVFDAIKAGGIYVDGKLKAFSLGNYNPYEEMAVIDIEKADPEIDGLYQLINREFLRHEFPEAKVVNREDDVGLEGLRRAKLSYYPIGFARKYHLKQKDF